MVSINTNLSSIMVQGNLNQATNGLNKAIERLSTGYKINHSSDNAANYSIANSYEAKLSSFDMAASNVGMGSDLLAVAQDTISSMQDHGARLHALITQARNGTYGAQSLNALTQEAGALISEIQRMYTNAEYNNVSLFDNIKLPDWAQEVKKEAGNITVKENGFIADIETVTPDVVVTEASQLASAISSNSIIGIDNAEVLAQLANLVNSGTSCSGKTIILTNDIDLSDYQTGTGWKAIGTSSKPFKGTFDGQGHKIKGLKINKPSSSYQGLFGYIKSGATIRNVGIVDCDIKCSARVAGLVGHADTNVTVSNSSVSGNVSGKANVGALVGYADGVSVSNSHADVSIEGIDNNIGGLVGRASNTSVRDSFATGSVQGSGTIGGLVGVAYTNSIIINTYATVNVTNDSTYSGGLVGAISASSVEKSFAKGNVLSTNNYSGGITGYLDGTISESYSDCDVSGVTGVGGIAGYSKGIVSKLYANGSLSGTDYIGGIIGRMSNLLDPLDIDTLFAGTKVAGKDKKGSLIGGVINTSDGTSFGIINITNANVIDHGLNVIGYEGAADGTTYESGQMVDWLANTRKIDVNTKLQVGIHGDESSKITFNTGFSYDLSAILRDIKSDDAYNAINKFMSTLSDKATELGSVSNRLESALDSIIVNMENITSSLSTIKDADMATESSQYIKMQILQQASATLLATANQSPSIALQLI